MFKHLVGCGRAAQYLGGSSDFVTNSYGESWDSFCEKSWVQVHESQFKKTRSSVWVFIAVCVTGQFIWRQFSEIKI